MYFKDLKECTWYAKTFEQQKNNIASYCLPTRVNKEMKPIYQLLQKERVVLAELAAANAAFAVIKQTLQNGKDIIDAGDSIFKFVEAKEDLRHRGEKKKNSFWGNKGGSELEEFMALEKIREEEEWIKEYMIWAGRPGLWQDWQTFQAKARKERQRKITEAERHRKELTDGILIGVLILIALGGIVGIVWWITFLQGI